MTLVTENLRIKSIRAVSTPARVQTEIPLSDAAADTVSSARREAQAILSGQDDRLLVVVGPCSIHNPDAALEYASRLAPLREELGRDLLIVMRVYFEKPRTTVGWKGLINDPDLNDTYEIDRGLRTGRKLLLALNERGLPAGVEFLDLLTPQYLADLVSWGAIGARTTESQSHRQLASGLSCPVGFKNGTDGSLRIAVDAIKAAAARHHFISITKSGHVGVFSTSGNEDTHVILRGGKAPNYDAASVSLACGELAAAGLRQQLMIDFSHANSSKQYQRQIDVAADVAAQVAGGDTRIIGAMVESHLNPGRQDQVPGQPLEYGRSITDACIGWDDTVPLLRMRADAVKKRRLSAPADEE